MRIFLTNHNLNSESHIVKHGGTYIRRNFPMLAQDSFYLIGLDGHCVFLSFMLKQR